MPGDVASTAARDRQKNGGNGALMWHPWRHAIQPVGRFWCTPSNVAGLSATPSAVGAGGAAGPRVPGRADTELAGGWPRISWCSRRSWPASPPGRWPRPDWTTASLCVCPQPHRPLRMPERHPITATPRPLGFSTTALPVPWPAARRCCRNPPRGDAPRFSDPWRCPLRRRRARSPRCRCSKARDRGHRQPSADRRRRAPIPP